MKSWTLISSGRPLGRNSRPLFFFCCGEPLMHGDVARLETVLAPLICAWQI
jgi:hypothetical protein